MRSAVPRCVTRRAPFAPAALRTAGTLARDAACLLTTYQQRCGEVGGYKRCCEARHWSETPATAYGRGFRSGIQPHGKARSQGHVLEYISTQAA